MASDASLGSLIRFGMFEVDIEAGELRKHGLKVNLQKQPFQILAMLLEHPGQVVTREELHKKLWADDTFVDFDRGLNRAVNRLRDALSDSADSPRFVETLPKRGYRFVAPIERTATQQEPPALSPELPQSAARSRTRLWAFVLVTALVAGAAIFYLTRRSSVLTERDTLVLADFDNRTADPAFDDTLKLALAIDLQQSPFLKILSDAEVAGTLRLMRRAPDQRLTMDVARDLCQRVESKVLLGGSIANLGSNYVIALKAINCRTGESMVQEQVRANRKEEVLNELDRAASDLRRKLGESLRSIEKYDSPNHDAVSTSSLEAFQAYRNGQRMTLLNGSTGIPFFKRAVELDPDFARPYVGLGLAYSAIGEPGLAAEYARKAYALIGRLTEWEKFDVSAQYFSDVTGQIEKVVEVGQVWSQEYPRDWIPHERLGVAYAQLGQYESALAQFRQARELGSNAIAVNSLARTNIDLDRLSDARAIVNQALAGNPDQLRFHQAAYLLSFFDADADDMRHHVAWGSQKGGVAESLLLSMQSDTEAYFGRLKQARDVSLRAEQSAKQNDLGESASLMRAVEAVREAEFGNTEAARRQARLALAAAPGPDSQALAALALAKAGGIAQARRLIDQLNMAFPSSTLIQNCWLPAIRAEIQLEDGNASRAIDLLQPTGSYELADTSMPMIPVYVRAKAYLRTKQGDAAAAEFQKILRHRGLLGNSMVAILAHLGLARAYALSGDTSKAKARAEYQEFFRLWKDADSEVPVLREARAEYSDLPSLVSRQ